MLAEVLQQYTRALLEEQGVTPSISFLDVGCGGGNVALMAAQMAGDNGSITGIDFDEEIISLAQQDAVASGMRNISFRAISAYDISYDNEFDVAYARFLLSHLKEPFDVLLKMKNSVKPGGKIIVEDVEFNGHFCYPVCKAFDEYLQYYTIAAQKNGANPDIGPSLFSLFHKAGIEEVGFDMIQPCFNRGPGKWMAYITMDRIKNTLLEHNIADRQTIDRILQELEGFTKDEQTIMSLPRIFRVWGIRK